MRSCEVLPGVFQIGDDMGVCMTLLVGKTRALLVDAGYGLRDVGAYVHALTDKPVTVMLTHAHHDHVLGARWFDETRLFAQDLPAFAVYTSAAQRSAVAAQAREKGITAPEDYLTAPIAQPLPLEAGEIDLGGMTADVRLCPGHTPGSAIVYVPERRLLLTGDNWNPCTWLFFPEALDAQSLRSNMKEALCLPFEHVLCGHRETLLPRAMIDAFFAGMTDEALADAHRVDMGRAIDTREIYPAEGQNFVFDFEKTGL